MRSARGTLGVACVLAGSVAVSGASAQETKALPTLLIKGEVVSMDTSDPAANLLKVKDRYGFETPIFITSETKIQGADASALAASTLSAGSAVEVEYNFDVNTAKRQAVSVKVTSLPAAAQPAEAAAAVAAPVAEASAAAAPVEASAVPFAESAPAPAAQPAASTPAPAVEPAAAPASQEQGTTPAAP